MLRFLTQQADYAGFVFGLSLMLLACACFMLRKDRIAGLAWHWLGIFAVIHGASNWLIIISNRSMPDKILQAVAPSILIIFGLSCFKRVKILPRLKHVRIAFAAAIAGCVCAGCFVAPRIEEPLTCIGIALAAAGITIAVKRVGRNHRPFLILFTLELLAYSSLVTIRYFHVSIDGCAELAGHFTLAILTCTLSYCLLGLLDNLPRNRFLERRLIHRCARNTFISVCLIVAAGWAGTQISGDMTDLKMSRQLKSRVGVMAASIDANRIKALSGTGADVNLPQFAKLKNILKKIRSAANSDRQSNLRFVYLMGQRNGKVVFLVDAEPADSKDYSPPGQVYDEATDVLKSVFTTGQPAIEGPASDRWGTWYSAMAPIIDPETCKTIALLGIDVNAEQWKAAVNDERIDTITVTILLAILAVSVFTSQYYGRRMAARSAEFEQRFKNVAANSNEIIWEIDAQGKILYVSELCEKLLGYSSKEMAGQPSYSFYDPAALERSKENLLRTISEKKPLTHFEHTFLHKDGRRVILEVSGVPVFDCAGTLVGYIGTSKDITAWKKAKDLLVLKEERFRKLVSHIPGAMFRSSADGLWTMEFISGQIKDITGIPACEFLKRGFSFKSMIHPGDVEQVESRIKAAMKTNRLYAIDYRIVDACGQVRWVSEKGRGIADEQGNINHIDGIISDVTERKTMESQLRDANSKLKEHDQLKNEFVCNVSHELRTPMTIFRNLLSNTLAGAYGPISDKLADRLSSAQSSIDRLNRIIGDFLDISKLDAGKMSLKMTCFSAQEMIRETLADYEQLAMVKSVQFNAYMPEQDIFIMADRDRIVQVLSNLVDNALKFSRYADGVISVRLKDLDGEIGFDVEDNGIGIEPDDISKLFNRFVQIEKQVGPGTHGTGLGLSISKQIIELHGGRIWIESTPGKGSNFCFVLPKSSESTLEQVQTSENLILPHDLNARA